MSESYYAELARDLHEVANRIATLADRDPAVAPPRYGASVNLIFGFNERNAEQTVPAVDAIADVFGVEGQRAALDERQYEAIATVGRVDAHAYTTVPRPEDAEAAQLRAESERLRDQLAAAILTPDSPELADGGAS